MEYPPQTSKMHLFGGSSSYLDPDIIELPSSSASTSFVSNQKRKRSQVPHDIIEIDEDDDQDGVVIIGEKLSDNKNKQPMMFGKDSKYHAKDFFPIVHESYSKTLKSESDIPSDKQMGSVLGPLDFSFPEDYDYDEFEDEYEDEYVDDDYEEYDISMDAFKNDSNLTLAAQFDDLDLPPGVEATVPWLKGASEMPKTKLKIFTEDEVDVKFKVFKQFDTARDHADHYYSIPELHKITSAAKKPTKDWAKRIQSEWKVLEKDLPETIYARIYEDRMDLLRAVIIGPSGTPYHDGLFFFDIYFPPNYPLVPPMVHYHSGGLRLNPNLYACGKVCLSLLNTWYGKGCEKWNPSNSTMLQVLVSIQALVLNAKPYFNEPGFTNSANTPNGEKRSQAYNEETFILSCKTMLYTLRRPPKHFEDLVAGHFRYRGHTILAACRAYIQGAQVGCDVVGWVQDVDEDKRTSSAFNKNLSMLFEQLLMEFTVKGADCEKFLAQKVKDGAVKAVAGISSAKGYH